MFYTGYLNSLNGASTIVRTLFDNNNIFLKNNINLFKLYSLDGKLDVKFISSSLKNSNFLNLKIRILLSRSYIGNIILFYRMWIFNSLKVINKYNPKYDTSNVFLFHDIFSTYSFLKTYPHLNKKLILVLHNNGETWKMLFTYLPKLDNPKFKLYLTKIENYVLAKVNKIVFVSKISSQTFLNIHPSFINKVHTIYNGLPNVKKKLKTKSDKNLHLISVGTVNYRKNHILLLKGLLLLNDKNISLTIVGDGDHKNKCIDFSIRNNIQKNVKFVGSQNNVRKFLRKSNLFVMTSLDEGLPIAVIEAMREKLPLILTDVGGNSELIDGNGILIKSNNLNELVNAITFFNKNRHLLNKYGNKSNKIFNSKFTSSAMINNYSNIIKDLHSEL